MRQSLFHRFASVTARSSGQPWAFGLALGAVIVWAVTGPLFQFSETWQLVINTGTTIITFLMVFLVQHTQNRDGEAIQAKLDDLIYAVRKADNRLIGAEELTSEELHKLRTFIASKAHVGAATVIGEEQQGDTKVVVTATKTGDSGEKPAPTKQPEKA